MRAALTLSLFASCVIDLDLSRFPPPCAAGYHEAGGVCVEGPGSDAGARDAPSPPERDSGESPDADAIDLSGCVLHFAFDDDELPPSFDDDCGANDRGTLGGGATSTAGMVGRAIAFDGTGCIEVADSSELRASNAVTMAAWIQPQAMSPGVAYGIVAKRTNIGSMDAYAMYLLDTLLQWDVEGEESRTMMGNTAPTAFALGVWRHVAVVYDASRPAESRIFAYIDGSRVVARPDASPAITAYASNLAVGCLPEDRPSQFFVGALDEVYVFARALSDQEIARLATR